MSLPRTGVALGIGYVRPSLRPPPASAGGGGSRPEGSGDGGGRLTADMRSSGLSPQSPLSPAPPASSPASGVLSRFAPDTFDLPELTTVNRRLSGLSRNPTPQAGEHVENERLGLHDPSVAGPAGQFVAAGKLEFSQHGRHVRLHRLDRDG